MVEEVFANYISNALKYGSDNGDVGVEDNPEGHGSVFWVTVKKA
ncbi:hypothetical protein [Methanococcoides orientis]|nr:hypothetical protein [Methanococcoides orientis]